MKLGAHVLIQGGLLPAAGTARTLGCECMQMFLHNPRGWISAPRSPDELRLFRASLTRFRIAPLAIHMPYLVNLASGDRRIVRNSRRLLEQELAEAAGAGAAFYVLHPGSHRGDGTAAGLERLRANLAGLVNDRVRILLENTAGAGNALGGRWEEFAPLLETFGERVGVCLDTAHAFEAGYDFRTDRGLAALCGIIEKSFPLRYIVLVHANDSLTEYGSHRDRHQHIGRGRLGLAGFEALIRHPHFGALPYIIETPKEHPADDKKNLATLRKIGVRYGKIGAEI